MHLTEALKQWARQHCGVAEGAGDEAYRAALGKALSEGKLPADKYAELAKDTSGGGAATALATVLKQAIQPLADEIKQMRLGGNPPPTGTPPVNGAPPAGGTPPPADDPLAKMIDARMQSMAQKMGIPFIGGDGAAVTGGVNPTELISRAAQNGWLTNASDIKVKSPLDRYSTAKSEARWPDNHKHADLRGKRMCAPSEDGMGRPLDNPSQADKAVAGAYFKWMANLTNQGEPLPGKWRMTEHDWALLKYSIHEMRWTGMLGHPEFGTPVDNEKLTDISAGGRGGVKALLDDTISGGIYAAPIVVEDAIILIPLLYGELFPFVTVTNLTRGRRITQPTMGTPTFTAGIPEGTPIPLFDTTGFIGYLDTNIYTAVGAMEIGNDFEEDSPSNIGQTVVSRYGEAALVWLDMVIAIGDGVTQPKGIFNTSGATVVHSANGTGGPVAIADAEALMFGINKAYRVSLGGRNVYVGNETSYLRFRAIPLGSTWANSRVLGMDYAAYTVLNQPYKIVPLVPNNQAAYINLAYYQMYRRLGLNIKVEMGGKELSLKNVKLIVCRMRYGGQVSQGGAVAIMSDMPA
jgi:HK97 family phage major capsid protein